MAVTAEIPAARRGLTASAVLQPRRPYLVFHLPGTLCALPASAIQELVPLPLLSRPPGRPALLEGFLNLGGAAVPVLRLDRLFGLPDLNPGLYTPLLILRQSEDRIALMVSALGGIVTVDPAEVRPIHGGVSFNDCVEGEIAVGDDAVSLLSVDRILLEKERQFLAEFQAAEQERLRDLEEVRL